MHTCSSGWVASYKQDMQLAREQLTHSEGSLSLDFEFGNMVGYKKNPKLHFFLQFTYLLFSPPPVFSITG